MPPRAGSWSWLKIRQTLRKTLSGEMGLLCQQILGQGLLQTQGVAEPFLDCKAADVLQLREGDGTPAQYSCLENPIVHTDFSCQKRHARVLGLKILWHWSFRCTVHGILQVRTLERAAFPSPGDLPNPGIELGSPALQADSLPTEPPGKLSGFSVTDKCQRNIIVPSATQTVSLSHDGVKGKKKKSFCSKFIFLEGAKSHGSLSL